LTRIELPVRRFDQAVVQNLGVDIRSTSGGIPVEANTPVLASADIPAARIPLGPVGNPPFFSIDLSAANLQVLAGDVLAIVLRSGDQYQWKIDTAGGYAAGSEYVRANPALWSTGTGDEDFAFRTFVEPAVPEPSTLILAAALVSVGLMLKRDRNSLPLRA
jgi:hypothetical protein